MNSKTKAQDNERAPVLNILIVLLEVQERFVAIGSRPEVQTTHLVVPTTGIVRL